MIAGDEEEDDDKGDAPEGEFDERDEEYPGAPEETEGSEGVTECERTRKGEREKVSKGTHEEEEQDQTPDKESDTESRCDKGREECFHGYES